MEDKTHDTAHFNFLAGIVSRIPRTFLKKHVMRTLHFMWQSAHTGWLRSSQMFEESVNSLGFPQTKIYRVLTLAENKLINKSADYRPRQEKRLQPSVIVDAVSGKLENGLDLEPRAS